MRATHARGPSGRVGRRRWGIRTTDGRGPAPGPRHHAASCSACDESGTNGGPHAELWSSGDQPVGDAGTEYAQTEKGKGGQHDGHGLFDIGLIAAKPGGEFTEKTGPDADDHDQNQHFDARRDDIAEQTFGEKRGLAEKAEWDQHETRKCRQFERNQSDEKLPREDKEGEQHHGPGERQHDDLDEVLEEAAIAHEIRDRGQNGLPGIEPNLSDMPGAHQIGGAKPGAAGLQTEPGETLKNDASERAPVRDDVGEGTDREGFLDQPREGVVIRTPGPEESRQSDADVDQRGGEEGNLAAQKTEATVDIAGEDLKEAVDDACAMQHRQRCGRSWSAETGKWRSVKRKGSEETVCFRIEGILQKWPPAFADGCRQNRALIIESVSIHGGCLTIKAPAPKVITGNFTASLTERIPEGCAMVVVVNSNLGQPQATSGCATSAWFRGAQALPRQIERPCSAEAQP